MSSGSELSRGPELSSVLNFQWSELSRTLSLKVLNCLGD